MIYSPDGLMRYNDSIAIVDDIPLLSQWIKKSRSGERDFLTLLFKKEPAKNEDYSNSLPQCGQYFENHGSFQKNVSQCGQRHQKYSKMQNITKKLISIDTPNPVVVKNL